MVNILKMHWGFYYLIWKCIQEQTFKHADPCLSQQKSLYPIFPKSETVPLAIEHSWTPEKICFGSLNSVAPHPWETSVQIKQKKNSKHQPFIFIFFNQAEDSFLQFAFFFHFELKRLQTLHTGAVNSANCNSKKEMLLKSPAGNRKINHPWIPYLSILHLQCRPFYL